MTKFIEEFEKRERNDDFRPGFEDLLIKDFLIKDELGENKGWIVMKYFEIEKKNFKDSYDFLSFLRYLGNNNTFTDNNIVDSLKNNLILNENLEDYFFLLDILFSLNKDDKKYYEDLFQLKKEAGKLSVYPLRVFTKIFKEFGNISLFIESSILLIRKRRFFSDDSLVWEYLGSSEINKKDFKKCFLEILKSFDNTIREKMDKYGDYPGIIDYKEEKHTDFELYKDNKKIVDSILNKIKETSFNKNERQDIEKFLFEDMNYIANKYQSVDLNYFDKNLFSILGQQDNTILYRFLQQSDVIILSRHNCEFIGNQLNPSNLKDCISLYKGKEDYFFAIYIFIKGKKDKILLKCLNNDKVFINHLKKIEEQRDKNSKVRKNKQKELEKERKKEWLDMTKPKKGIYFPKLLQDYAEYIINSKTFNEFTKKEKEKLDNAVIDQSLKCLKSVYIETYYEENIKNIVYFEKTGDSSYKTSWYPRFLYRILIISKNLNLDISEYYKSYVLMYPLIFGDQIENDFLDFLKGQIKSKDIDYILKAYSEDLHDNAIGLRYYNPKAICGFYNFFGKQFSKHQKEKLKEILLEFIGSENIRYKDVFIENYEDVIESFKMKKEEKLAEFKKIYKQPTINYFKSIISNEVPISETDKFEFEKQLKINELLITKFKNKNALLWRIKQIKNGAVKYKNPYKRNEEDIISYAHGVSDLEDELELRYTNGSNSFSYVVRHPNGINIWKEMLDIFESGLKFSDGIKYGVESVEYNLYSKYLLGIFSDYIRNHTKGIKKNRNKINNIIKKYPNAGIGTKFLMKNFGDNLDNFPIKFGGRVQEPNLIKNIVIVEGKTDKIILENARRKLYPDIEKNFIISYAGGCKYLAPLLDDISNGIQNGFFKGDFNDINKIIGIFDFDHEGYYAYKTMIGNNLRERTEFSEIYGLRKQTDDKKISALMIPIPQNKKIFADKNLDCLSMIELENLFEDYVFKQFIKLEKIDIDKGNKIKIHKFSNKIKLYQIDNHKENKEKFANFTANLDKSEFKNFIPLFDQIKKIINED